jgi:hypothetical protein
MIYFLKHGLSNRLRVLLALVFISIKTGRHFTVYWYPDSQCNGTYDELFHDIPDVYGSVKIICEPFDDKKKYDFVGQDTLENILKREDPTLLFYGLKNIKKYVYGLLRPRQHLINQATGFIKTHPEIKTAIHVRRTDHSCISDTRSDFINDEKVEEMIKSGVYFLLTDNKATQDKFRRPNIFVFKRIEESPDLRQTPLQQALIEALIASNYKLIGSAYSSFSELVRMLAVCDTLSLYKN